MRNFLYTIGTFFYFCTCSSDKYDNINPYYMQEDSCKYKMELSGTISFKLDSVTSNFTTASEENSDYFSFLTNNNEIQIFYYKTKEFQCKIPLSIKGITTYSIKNKDSVLLYDYLRQRIILSDMSGELKDAINISHKAKYYPSPVTGISPLIIDGNTVIVSGNMAGEYIDENEENRPSIFSFDLKSKKLEYIFAYPQHYFNYNWGGGLFRWVYSTYNMERHLTACSYPSDHYIHSFNISEKKVNTHYAGSRFIEKISSLPKSKTIPIDSDEKTKHFAENHSYSNLCYDNISSVYYRIAEFKTQYEGVPGWKKELSIIILDRDFNVIGETKIGKSHAPTYRYTLFVNSNGLHIQQDSDENQILFNIYKIKK